VLTFEEHFNLASLATVELGSEHLVNSRGCDHWGPVKNSMDSRHGCQNICVRWKRRKIDLQFFFLIFDPFD